jgi:repressor LexA
MKGDLTKKQQVILDYIRNEVQKKGYPPSVREICEGVGLKSTSTVHGHLNKLEEKGYIRRDPTKPRAIELLGATDNVLQFKRDTAYVPIVGEVTAGQPILAVENIEESYPVPREFVENGAYFMLQIKGESMIEAGILDRDYVLVKQQQDATNGDIVVALIEDSATCKTFYREKNRIRLQPENSSMDPIYSDNVSILGVVKGVFRRL